MRFLCPLIGWFLLLAVCWPLALLVILLAPVLWLLWQPLRLLGCVFEGLIALVRAVVLLPARLLGYRERRAEPAR